MNALAPFPHSLLKPETWPEKWPAGEAKGAFWISTLAMGGPMAALRKRSFESQSEISLSVPTDFFTSAAVNGPSWQVLIESELSLTTVESLRILSHADLSIAERQAWQLLCERVGGAHSGERERLGVRFESDKRMNPPTLFEWSREIFPQSYVESGELLWRRELLDYDQQISPHLSSMDSLRFFPGHLRRKSLEIASVAAGEWAFAEALFSPQSEEQGSGDCAVVNPTLNIHEDLAIWRREGRVTQRKIDWQEAAVIDELLENPRIQIAVLESELEAKAFPFKDRRSFQSVIQTMTAEHFILRR